MKNHILRLWSIILFSGALMAQTSSPPTTAPAATAPPGSSNKVAAGVVIPAELSKGVDAKKLKAGDKIEAKTAVDMLSNGEIVIPRNSKIEGHITSAKPRSKQSPDSLVAFVFDKITMKDGRELPVQAIVQAIGRPLQAAPGYSSMGESPVPNSPVSAPGPGGSTGTMGGPSGGNASGGTMSDPHNTYPSGFPQSRDNSMPGSSVSPLGPTSQGVVGMKGLSLSNSAEASTISSSTENVHLDGGTQLILRTE